MNPQTYVKLTEYERENNIQEITLVEYFLNLFIGQIKIEGLPDSIPPDIPMRWIYWWRNVCIFEAPGGKLAALPPIVTGDIDMYWRPTKWRVTGANGFTKELNNKNSVIIWNDRGRTCPYWHILPWIKRIVELRNTQDINMNAQKTPFVWSGSKDELLSAANFYQQLTGGKPVMFTSKKMRDHLKEATVFNTDVPFKGLDFSRQEQIYVNNILTYMGVLNVNVEKRERMVEDEANANTELTRLNLASRFEQQQYDWDRVNKMFGIHARPVLPKLPQFPGDGQQVSDENKTAENQNKAV